MLFLKVFIHHLTIFWLYLQLKVRDPPDRITRSVWTKSLGWSLLKVMMTIEDSKQLILLTMLAVVGFMMHPNLVLLSHRIFHCLIHLILNVYTSSLPKSDSLSRSGVHKLVDPLTKRSMKLQLRLNFWHFTWKKMDSTVTLTMSSFMMVIRKIPKFWPVHSVVQLWLLFRKSIVRQNI